MQLRQNVMCVASALVCSILLSSAAWGVYEKDFTTRGDFANGMSDRVTFSEEVGGLSLSLTENCAPFIWVPSPNENSITKINARTGSELAKYRIGPNDENWAPCAATADLKGNTYVACNNYEGTGRIIQILAPGEAAITAVDSTIAQSISTQNIDSSGQGIRIGKVFEVGSIGASPSCLAFDANGYLWVGLWGERAAAKVDIRTGQVITTVPLNGKPSSMVADSMQNLWVLSRENRVLCQVNTLTNVIVDIYELSECYPYGMCLDGNGRLLIGDLSNGLQCLNIATHTWTSYSPENGSGCAGVTVDSSGDIWVTCPEENEVVHFSGEDGSLLASIQVGISPKSICVDSDDYIWVFNEGAETATRIDTKTNKQALTVPVNTSTVNGTPFASSVVKKGISPIGNWSVMLDSEIPGAAWGKVLWDAVPGSGSIKVYVRVAETPTLLAACELQEVDNSVSFSSSNGRYMEIKALLTGDGNSSPILRGLRVEGVNQAPNVLAAAPTVSLLRDPDHNMQSVGISGVYDPDGDPFEIIITSVTQDEPIAGLSEDDKFPDAIGAGSPTVWLRGELDEGTIDNPSNGRVYTLNFKAIDAAGAVSDGEVKVTVPKGILPTDIAIDDGQKYDSSDDSRQLIAQNVD